MTADSLEHCSLDLRVDCIEYSNRYEFEMSALFPPDVVSRGRMLVELSFEMPSGYLGGAEVRLTEREGRHHWTVKVRKSAVAWAEVGIVLELGELAFDAWVVKLDSFSQFAHPPVPERCE